MVEPLRNLHIWNTQPPPPEAYITAEPDRSRQIRHLMEAYSWYMPRRIYQGTWWDVLEFAGKFLLAVLAEWIMGKVEGKQTKERDR